MAQTTKRIKKVFVGLAGFTILALGLIMLLTPMPAILVIPVGLSVLATEFECMKKVENKFKMQLERLRNKF
jgi:hypothetical protein